MTIYDYCTDSGKNIILDYVISLPKAEQAEIIDARDIIEKDGLKAFQMLHCRQLRSKLWEIKISQTRIMYVIISSDSVVFLHICKKQKGKAEKKDINLAINRAKSQGLM